MKSLVNLINESSMHWTEIKDIKWNPKASFIHLYPRANEYGFYTEEDIEAFVEDFGDDPENVKVILGLKPGESYSPDGDCIYIRIKK